MTTALGAAEGSGGAVPAARPDLPRGGADERAEPGPGEGPGGPVEPPEALSALPRAVDLYDQIHRVVSALIVASRAATLVMVGLSVVAAHESGLYASVPLAAGVYVLVFGWSVGFAGFVLRTDRAPGWALATDIAVTAVSMVALPFSVTDRTAFNNLANPEFEPLTVAIAISVALVTCSLRWVLITAAVFGSAYALTQVPIVRGPSELASATSIIVWQLGAGVVAYLFIRQLRRMADLVEVAITQVVTEREAVVARRAYTEERLRQFHEHVRRYRALHDGPLRILRAVAGPGPAAHPDAEVRRQCAVSVNVLRGAAPDDPAGTLTDLSLALIEAGNAAAPLGLRVEYHFAHLPEDLPADVVSALSRAAAEALSNVAAHAGTGRARLTALASGASGRPGVTVAVVDQGCGFDPATVEPGYGLRQSVLGRMADVGGSAGVDSHPGQGTRIDLWWPA